MSLHLISNIGRLFDKDLISRRDFLKFTSLIGSMSFIGSALKGLRSSAMAATGNPRVVSVHNSLATNWDYVTGYHWEYINQDVVNDMMIRGVKALTGRNTAADAWAAIIPYQPGESVTIKLNFNNALQDRELNSNAEAVNAVIDGLVSIGVPQDKIWISDPSRSIALGSFINRINYSDVKYFTTYPWALFSENTYLTDYVDADSEDASPTTHPAGDIVRPAKIFVETDHLINMPLLKGHGQGWATLGLKNHYGSVTFRNYPAVEQHDELMRMHEYLGRTPPYEKCILTDINNNPHIRDKTRLIIGDGLFGHPIINWDTVAKWEIFGNDDPNILFFGIDPIATDSVMCDYINEEQTRTIERTVGHTSLHYGAELGLGVHDHWDGFETKRYAEIDYINIDLDRVSRFDLDLMIRDFKSGLVTEEEILEMINVYMETN